MPDSESGPWESHPRRVLRRFRRKVSLYPKPVVAVSVAARYFRMVSGSLSTFCPVIPLAAGGSWRTFIWLLAQGMYLMNVYEIFKVPGRLFAFSLSLCRIFLRDSHTFSKKFFVPVPENKKAPTAPV